ncbi:hypothetical protein OBBRIDRAFT_888324 [Obba rivulosa]|uniref:Fork-head domain-containing protein n=1 Tax=Obba rivulosa TaxID=1052685 RepID=A0A8E2B1M0_9APHY|nr:hypothetical protein OBBRIDRAFT_888324 [Obba rivulosa]
MASVDSLLNPASSSGSSSRPPKRPSETGSPSSSPENTEEQTVTEQSYYGQADAVVRPHEPHPQCPNTLSCLPDTDGRPQHTLPVILRCAILGSPKKRLTIREIYAAMERKYPYYLTAGPAWKQSVRHHLSLNRLFERQPRPATDPGFGSYWTVNLEAPPGTKRPRKRGRPNKAGVDPNTIVQPPVLHGPPVMLTRPMPPHDDVASSVHHPLGHFSMHTPIQPAHHSPIHAPGQPPHHPLSHTSNHTANHTANHTSNHTANHTPNHANIHPPGHPPNSSAAPTLRPVDSRSFSYSSLPRANGIYDPDEDDEMDWDASGDATPDDDDVSEEDAVPPPYRHIPDPPDAPTSASPNSPTSKSGLHGAFATFGSLESPSNASSADRLKTEVTSLRKQAADLMTQSMRLQDQLAAAQQEASRAKASLQMLENRLEDETRRRREAEKMADEESRLRRVAEDTLRAYQTQRRAQHAGYTSSRS